MFQKSKTIEWNSVNGHLGLIFVQVYWLVMRNLDLVFDFVGEFIKHIYIDDTFYVFYSIYLSISGIVTSSSHGIRKLM